MRVIGFNFTKIAAERKVPAVDSKKSLDFQIIDFEKEEFNLLKDAEAYKAIFKHTLTYESMEEKNKDSLGEIIFEGSIVLALAEEEREEIMKSWKKKELPNTVKIFLSNVILKNCTPITIQLQNEVGLPFHVPMPKLTPTRDSESPA